MCQDGASTMCYPGTTPNAPTVIHTKKQTNKQQTNDAVQG